MGYWKISHLTERLLTESGPLGVLAAKNPAKQASQENIIIRLCRNSHQNQTVQASYKFC